MTEPIPVADFPDPLIEERARRRTAYFKRSVSRPLVIVPMIAAVALALLSPYLVPVAWVLVLAIAFSFANRQAAAEWWFLLLEHVGMEPELISQAQPVTPLLRSGDEREVLRAGADTERTLMVFRSTDVTEDSKGNKSRSHHDFTVVLYRRAPTAAITFLSAHEHRVSWMKFLGDELRGKTLRGVEEFQVESIELHQRFELRSSTADGSRARQIFQPSFIVWFARGGVPFEYEEGDLAVFVDRVLEHAEEVKMLLAKADKINAALQA